MPNLEEVIRETCLPPLDRRWSTRGPGGTVYWFERSAGNSDDVPLEGLKPKTAAPPHMDFGYPPRFKPVKKGEGSPDREKGQIFALHSFLHAAAG